MSLHAYDIDRAWAKLGMMVKESGDRRAQLWVKGKLVITTRRSHGAGKLDGNIPHYIRQQLRLNQDQFDALIACPLGLNEYLQILKAKGLL